jgi:hypothetical protein
LYSIDNNGNIKLINSVTGYLEGDSANKVDFRDVKGQKVPGVLLYEGIKFQDKFRITAPVKPDWLLIPYFYAILISYLEKMDDVIWLYLKENTPELLPSVQMHDGWDYAKS